MALWKAKIEFNDNRVTGEAWQAFKADKKKCPNGSVPVMELGDGTVLTQTMSMLNYVGEIGNLKPKDPMTVAKGDMVLQRFWGDIIGKMGPIMFGPGTDEEKAEKMKTVLQDYVVPYFDTVTT